MAYRGCTRKHTLLTSAGEVHTILCNQPCILMLICSSIVALSTSSSSALPSFWVLWCQWWPSCHGFSEVCAYCCVAGFCLEKQISEKVKHVTI